MPDEFDPLDWQTGPGGGTPLNEANLDRMEAGIESADDRLDALEPNVISKTIVDAKGDLIAGTAADTVARVPGTTTDGHVLTWNAAATTGMIWAAAAGGSSATTLHRLVQQANGTYASRPTPGYVDFLGSTDPGSSLLTGDTWTQLPFLGGSLVGDRNLRAGSLITDAGGTYRLRQIARVSVSALQLTFANWSTVTAGTGDVNGTTAYTINSCYLEHNGALSQVLFDGIGSITVSPGTNVQGTVTKTIGSGDTYYVRTYVTPASGGTYPKLAAGALYFPDEKSRKSANHANELGDTNLTDFGDMFGPCAITGTVTSGTQRSVAVLGDSISFGSGDDFSSPDHTGFLYRALYGNRAFMMSALAGESGALFLTQGLKRKRYVGPAANYVICQYGINDLQGSATLTQLKATLIQIWSEAKIRNPSTKVFQTTITPKSSSTDVWATTTNQTADGTVHPVRPAANDWIRAGAPMLNGVGVVPGTTGALLAGQYGHPLQGYFEIANLVESTTNSGLWKPNHTSDGIHPNITGHVAMVPGIDLAVLV